jgi:hypothetical protein
MEISPRFSRELRREVIHILGTVFLEVVPKLLPAVMEKGAGKCCNRFREKPFNYIRRTVCKDLLEVVQVGVKLDRLNEVRKEISFPDKVLYLVYEDWEAIVQTQQTVFKRFAFRGSYGHGNEIMDHPADGLIQHGALFFFIQNQTPRLYPRFEGRSFYQGVAKSMKCHNPESFRGEQKEPVGFVVYECFLGTFKQGCLKVIIRGQSGISLLQKGHDPGLHLAGSLVCKSECEDFMGV